MEIDSGSSGEDASFGFASVPSPSIGPLASPPLPPPSCICGRGSARAGASCCCCCSQAAPSALRAGGSSVGVGVGSVGLVPAFWLSAPPSDEAELDASLLEFVAEAERAAEACPRTRARRQQLRGSAARLLGMIAMSPEQLASTWRWLFFSNASSSGSPAPPRAGGGGQGQGCGGGLPPTPEEGGW